jgi:integrase
MIGSNSVLSGAQISASALAMKGAPMGVIAPQFGHSDTRMTEKHYAHLAPSYIADRVRAALPGFGILAETNIATFRSRP